MGDACEYAEMTNDAEKMTVKGSIERDSIDTIHTKDCDLESKPADAQPTTNGASPVK